LKLEAFIIYDESSSPSADDYIIRRRRIIRLKPAFKNPTAGKPVSYAQTGLKFQSRRKKLILTTKPVLVTQMGIVCVNGRFNMLGCS